VPSFLIIAWITVILAVFPVAEGFMIWATSVHRDAKAWCNLFHKSILQMENKNTDSTSLHHSALAHI